MSQIDKPNIAIRWPQYVAGLAGKTILKIKGFVNGYFFICLQVLEERLQVELH